MKFDSDIINFFSRQGFVIVSTLDSGGQIHCSAKGLVDIREDGRIYIVDLYRANTFKNIKHDPTISITAVDEHEFTGYTLKGKAEIVEKEAIEETTLQKWHERVVSRVSTRLIKNIRKDKGSSLHPESRFPDPQYLIVINAEEVVNLSPAHLKRPSTS